MKFLRHSCCLLFSMCIVLFNGGGGAYGQMRVESEYASSRIIAETSGLAPGQTSWFAFRQELRPGWHVFWINPGDAGLPLSLKWQTPAGYLPGEILHPVPDYIPVGPLASYAHEGAPVFLVSLTAPATARSGDIVDIILNASWQTCEEICVPEEGQFSFSMPVVDEPVADPALAPLFAKARAALPVTMNDAASVRALGDDYELRMAAPADINPAQAFFFAEPEGLIAASGEQSVVRDGDALVITMKPGWLDNYDGPSLNGVFAFEDKSGARRGVTVQAKMAKPLVKPLQRQTASVQQGAGLGLLLLLAFAGGAVLNIMPCVFPIVFIKAASFARSARENPAQVRAHGLLYSAGVLSTFLLMGGVLLALRAGGAQFGWGFHLQSPAVVALSAYVLLLVGLNLSGLFTIGQSVAGSGQALASKQGGAGAFFTGALAVVVAAPCIGPLLGAPMGAALLLSPAAGMAIFAALGLGLAAPYLALSFLPGLGRHMPKPGPWMSVFKQLLAFPVFGAAAYFLWVLAQQADGAGLGLVLAGAVLIAFAAWGFEQSKISGKGGLVLRGAAALAAAAALAPLARLEAVGADHNSGSQASIETYGAMRAEPYSLDALDAYRAAGVPVFIDFTAAWCVTCQFNKMTVFSDPALARDFENAGAVFMVADWTVRDPAITAALQSFGASGVPLYVYYPQNGPVVILPQPLRKQLVRAVLSGADKS